MFKLNAGAPEGSAIPNIWYLHFPTQSFSSIEERIDRKSILSSIELKL
jgi:hypothetical protein